MDAYGNLVLSDYGILREGIRALRVLSPLIALSAPLSLTVAATVWIRRYRTPADRICYTIAAASAICLAAFFWRLNMILL
ncbi:MAG TPA: hypothetical protein VN381_06455 [Anaerovoracaceae bacterium]|nr:hypothetical protein [Anaerovoracaceae bacterium]